MLGNKKRVLLATAKGLVSYQKQSHEWTLENTHFPGQPASMVYCDQRNQRWWASLAHRHWGQKLHFSDNEGETWKEVPAPRYPEYAEIRPGEPATLKYIWSIAGDEENPKRLMVGTEPGGLFVSNDSGNSFSLVESLWNHPSRPEHWFGGGRDNAGIHSIVFDPRNSDHFYIGVSCAGVFETTDNGKSWIVRNKGLRADYLPDPMGEFGHDPHAIKICGSHPDIIWQQNHCGIFRSTDAGRSWLDVSDQEGLANYGFALAIDDEDPDVAWVIPAISDQVRIAVDFSLCVCRTEDSGQTWHPFRKGLPQRNSFDIVLRHSLAKSGDTLVFGTNTGNLFISEDRGESWEVVNNYLPTIFALCFA